MTGNDVTAEAATVREDTTEHLRVRFPDLLAKEEDLGCGEADLILVAVDCDLPFRPNVMFTSVPSAAPLVDASVTALTEVWQQHPGARVVNVDGFYGASVPVEEPPIGRVITFTYPWDERIDIMVKKWVIATGEHHLHVSASFLPLQARVVEEIFDWIAANLQFVASREAIRAASVGMSEVGAGLDEEATDLAGFPLEDLAIVPTPTPQSARAVPVGAVVSLAEAWGVHLGQPKVLHIAATRSGEQGFYAAYAARDGILVVRSGGVSAHEWDAANVQAYGLDPERLPSDAAAWMGLVPGFRFGSEQQMTLEEYGDRIAGEQSDVPWIEFQVGSLDDRWLRAVHEPGAGFFEAISPVEGQVVLDVLPAGRLFDLVLRYVDSALAAGGAVDDAWSDSGREQASRD